MTEYINIEHKEKVERVPVAAQSDVLVIGGGSAGVTAAVSAARNGCFVTLVERYGHLGGMASGGMVLVLDDMINGKEITTTGIVEEFVERMAAEGMAVFPPENERNASLKARSKWESWGFSDFHQKGDIKSIVYAVAFDPDAWKRASLNLVQENKINLRLHSWFSDTIVEHNAVKGVICQSKEGRQALLGSIVIDSSGDLDVGAAAGAELIQDNYLITTVFRLANVDVDSAVAFEHEEPEEFKLRNRKARQILGGSWGRWWLRTPLPGVVWCNCPHMAGYSGLSVEDLTKAECQGRERMMDLFEYARANLPGFEKADMLGAAEQIGVRQTRLLRGEYVVTMDDLVNRRHFVDSVCRGRDYYTPYRALLPTNIEQLIVAGRHYSIEPDAQRIGREIPPCMVQGEAAGVAAAIALNRNCTLREVDYREIQVQMRKQGADPGDVPSNNAGVRSKKDALLEPNPA